MNGWAIGVNNLVWERAIRNFLFLCHREQDFPVPLSWDTHTHTHTHTHTTSLRASSRVFDLPCVCAQSRSTLCKPMDCSPPGSSVRGISQARILQWVAISSSRGYSRPRGQTQVLISPALAGGFFTIFITRATWEASEISIMKKIKWSGMTDRGRQRRATFYADFYLKWSLCFLACWFFNCVFFFFVNLTKLTSSVSINIFPHKLHKNVYGIP